jgi:hypothetical protein
MVIVPVRVLEGAKIGARIGERYMGGYPSWDAAVKTSTLAYEKLWFATSRMSSDQ